MTRRRGFVHALTPLFIVLLLGLVALKTYVQLDAIANRATQVGRAQDDFFVRQARGKVYTQAASLVLIPLAVAGGVGAAAYFFSGRRPGAADVGMAIPLGLTVATLGYQAFNYLAHGGANQPAPAPIAASPTPQPAVRTPVNTPQPSASNPTPVQPTQRTPFNPPAPPPPHQTSPPEHPNTSTPPADPPPATPKRTTPASASFTDVLAAIRTDHPEVGASLDALTTKFDEDLTTLDTQADELLADLRNPRITAKKAHEARAAKAGEMQALAENVRSRLTALTTDASAALTGAGLSIHDASTLAFRLGEDAKSFDRIAAIHAYQSHFQALSDLSTLMADNPTKWKRTKDGTIEAKDAALNGQMRSKQFWIEQFTKDREASRSRLLAR